MQIGALHGDATICNSTESHDISASFFCEWLKPVLGKPAEAGWDVAGLIASTS